MLNDEWGPEETQVLRGDADNILLHSAADAIERRDVEIKRLKGERQGIVNEREKFRTWSSVLCDAHVGRPIRKCPWCWLDETERRAEKAEAAIAERDAEIERLKAYENRCSAEKNCVAGKINMREGSG